MTKVTVSPTSILANMQANAATLQRKPVYRDLFGNPEYPMLLRPLSHDLARLQDTDLATVAKVLADGWLNENTMPIVPFSEAECKEVIASQPEIAAFIYLAIREVTNDWYLAQGDFYKVISDFTKTPKPEAANSAEGDGAPTTT